MKKFKFSFVVDESKVQLITGLLIKEVTAWSMQEVVPPPKIDAATGKPVVEHEDTAKVFYLGAVHAKVLSVLRAEHPEGARYEVLAKVLPEFKLKEQSIHTVLAALKQHGKIEKVGRGRYKAT